MVETVKDLFSGNKFGLVTAFYVEYNGECKMIVHIKLITDCKQASHHYKVLKELLENDTDFNVTQDFDFWIPSSHLESYIMNQYDFNSNQY